MHKTPWTKSVSSLPSDRLRPKSNAQQKQGQPKSKTQPSPGVVGVQKSKEVRELESLIANLDSHITPVRDAKGGCFCLVREHALSPYTPLCISCGLILCKLNKPYHTCPHCGSAEGLLTPAQRTSLLVQLRETLDATLAREESDRLRQIEEAKKAAGAFPSLSSTTSHPSAALINTNVKVATPTPLRPSSSEPHKVLSLTNAKSKGGKKLVTVSSYTSTPTSSRPATPSSINSITEPTEEPENRVPPPPPQTVHYVANRHVNPARPWQNQSDDTVRYIPPPGEAAAPTSSEKLKSRRKVKGRGGGEGNGSG